MRFVLALWGVEFLRVEFGPQEPTQPQEGLFEIVHNHGGDFTIADGHEDTEPEDDEYSFGFAV